MKNFKLAFVFSILASTLFYTNQASAGWSYQVLGCGITKPISWPAGVELPFPTESAAIMDAVNECISKINNDETLSFKYVYNGQEFAWKNGSSVSYKLHITSIHENGETFDGWWQIILVEDELSKDQYRLTEIGDSCGGNPISFLNQDKFQTEYDVIDFDGIEFTRTYNSVKPGVNTLSKGWEHNYGRKLSALDGTAHKYIKDENNNFTLLVDLLFLWPPGTYGGHEVKDIISPPSDDILTAKMRNQYTSYMDTVDPIVKAQKRFVTYLPHNAIRLKTDGEFLTYRLNQNVKEVYSLSTGQLVKLIEPNDEKILAYEAGRLKSVFNTRGNGLNFEYDADGKLKFVRSTANDIWEYTYDINGNLASVIKPDNTVRQYHYENTDFPHLLTGVTLENNKRYSTFEYDTYGNAISTYHGSPDTPAGERVDEVRVVHSWTTGGFVYRKIQNSKGEETVYKYRDDHSRLTLVSIDGPGFANCKYKGLTKFEYNNDGRKTKVNTNGTVTLYGNYDTY